MIRFRPFVVAWVMGWALINGLITDPSSAASGDPVTMRSWQHANGGRLSIEWLGPIKVHQKREGNRLILRFSRSLSIDPRPALDRLAGYLDPDRTTIEGTDLTLDLMPDVSANLQVHQKNIVIIDFSKKNSDEPDIKIGLSALQNGMRLALDWPRPLSFEQSKQDNKLRLTFNIQGRIGPVDLSYLNETLRPWFSELQQRRSPAGTSLIFDLQPMVLSTVKHMGERRVVIDLTRDASLLASSPTAVPVPAIRPKPRPLTSRPPDASLPPLPKRRPNVLSEAVSEDQPDAIDETALHQIEVSVDEMVFDWDGSVGAAVFKRAGYLWVIFDAPPSSSHAALPPPSPPPLMGGEMIEADQATAMRFLMISDTDVHVRRDDLGRWSIQLEADPVLPYPVTISSIEKPRALRVIAASNGRIINVTDPLVGDEISIWPLLQERAGQRQPRRFVDLELLASAQGLVWRSLNDQLIAKALPDGIELSSQQGLVLSAWPEGDAVSEEESSTSSERSAAIPKRSQHPEKLPDTKASSEPAPSPDDRWVKSQQASIIPRPSRRPSVVPEQQPEVSTPSSYLDLAGTNMDRALVAETRRILRQAIGKSSPGQRDQARLDLARLLVAERLASEAKIVLRNISENTDDTINASKRALRGAAAFLTGDLDEASSLLRAPGFDKDDEIEIWRAALESLGKNWQIAAEGWKASGKNLDIYPPKLRLELGLLALETAIETDDDNLIRKGFQRLKTLELQPYEMAHVDRMHALKAERDGDVDRAKRILKTLADGRYHDLSIIADFQLASLTEVDDPNSLDLLATLNERLPLWRGHPQEVDMIDSLARRYRDAKEPKKALGLWQHLSEIHPRTEDDPVIREARQATFIDALTNPSDQKIRLLEAYSLYLDFINLLPTGKNARNIHRDLARHLAGLDLLYEAVIVFQPLLESTADAIEKAEIGAELAALLLLQEQPESALSVLNRTVPRLQILPRELMEERHLVRARTLASLSRDDEALRQIRDLQSSSARHVRAEIFWKQRNWARLTSVLESLLEDPEVALPLSADDQKLVLWLALARAQQGQVRQLSELRRRYAADMASSLWSDAFIVATQTAGRGGDIMSVLGHAERQLAELRRFRESAGASP